MGEMEATVQCFCLRLSERKMPNNVFFYNVDRPKTRHVRTKCSLPGQHDGPPYKYYFKSCKGGQY